MQAIAKVIQLGCLVILLGCDGCEGAIPVRLLQPETVQVFISNGRTQCVNNPVPLPQTYMLLVQGGIDVLCSECGVITGVAYSAICGAATGEIKIHRARRENVVDAERLGLRNVADIGKVPGVPGTGFQVVTANCITPYPGLWFSRIATRNWKAVHHRYFAHRTGIN
jgi:hypothetical protein